MGEYIPVVEVLLGAPAEPAPMSATEIEAFSKAAPQAGKEARSRSEDVFLNGMQIGTVAIYKCAIEQKETFHFAHQHADDNGKTHFAKLEQAYKCLHCHKEVPYHERVRVSADKSETEYFENATLKPEDTGAEGGLVVEGVFKEQVRTDHVKEAFFIGAKRFKLKKEKPKDQANINAIWTLVKASCAQPILCKFKGRRAVWMGESFFVLWNEDELRSVPKNLFPNATENPGLKQALTMLSTAEQPAVSIATV